MSFFCSMFWTAVHLFHEAALFNLAEPEQAVYLYPLYNSSDCFSLSHHQYTLVTRCQWKPCVSLLSYCLHMFHRWCMVFKTSLPIFVHIRLIWCSFRSICSNIIVELLCSFKTFVFIVWTQQSNGGWGGGSKDFLSQSNSFCILCTILAVQTGKFLDQKRKKWVNIVEWYFLKYLT